LQEQLSLVWFRIYKSNDQITCKSGAVYVNKKMGGLKGNESEIEMLGGETEWKWN